MNVRLSHSTEIALNALFLFSVKRLMDKFKKRKEAILNGVDLSRKGSIDASIVHLVQLINDQEQCVTTSSCSGRICLVEQVMESSLLFHCESGSLLYKTHIAPPLSRSLKVKYRRKAALGCTCLMTKHLEIKL